MRFDRNGILIPEAEAEILPPPFFGVLLQPEIAMSQMAKVEFESPILSVRGMLTHTDPYYIRRYPASGGGVMHIVQSRPDRSGHKATPAEAANRQRFAEEYGRQRHKEYRERSKKDQLEIPF